MVDQHVSDLLVGVRSSLPAPKNIKKTTKRPYSEYKERQKPYQRKWLKDRRDAWLKENGPCKICKTWDNLEIDHINPKFKKYKIAKIWSRKKEFRDKELAKCQVLCKKHHLEKTVKERIKKVSINV